MTCKPIAIIFLFILIVSCNTHKKEIWTPLFNGKNLEGWTPKIRNHPLGDNYKNTFVVEDGILKVSYKAYDSFRGDYGHLFYKTPYSDYKFRMDYRFTGKQIREGKAWAYRNSGIMIHCEDPKNMELHQNFPVSIEVQLLGGNGVEERATGNLCTPGTHVFYNDTLVTEHIIQSSSKTYHGNQWVHVEIEVRNDSIIKHFINGNEVLRYSKPHIGGGAVNTGDKWKPKENQPLKRGYISLQSESHPVEFKNIELLELK